MLSSDVKKREENSENEKKRITRSVQSSDEYKELVPEHTATGAEDPAEVTEKFKQDVQKAKEILEESIRSGVESHVSPILCAALKYVSECAKLYEHESLAGHYRNLLEQSNTSTYRVVSRLLGCLELEMKLFVASSVLDFCSSPPK